MTSGVEHSDSLPTQDKTEEKPERAWSRYKKLAAIGSLALTILASTFATKEETPKHPTTHPNTISTNFNNGKSLETSVDTFDVIPGQTSFSLPGVEVTHVINGTTDTIVNEFETKETDIQLMEWARLFDADPKAIEPRGQKAIEDTVTQIEKLEDNGWNIDQITIKGFASDEADSRVGDNPGFGIDDPKNVKLANKRSSAVTNLIKQQIDKNLDPVSASIIKGLIKIEPGEEIHDKSLADDIDKMADSLNMTTVDLVMQFNRHPNSLPTDAQKLLDGLKQYRFVRVEIEASKRAIVGHDTREETPLVIVPIIIPIFRRKKEPETTPLPPIDKPKKKVQNNNFERVPVIGKARDGYRQTNNRIIQPRPFNYSQGGGARHEGQKKTLGRKGR